MKIFRFIPLLVAVTGVILFIVYNNNLNQKFIDKEFKSIIVKRNNWQLRTTEFYLQNRLRIDSNHVDNFDLKIGDSIAKKANTRKFSVYRKNQLGEYQFLESYKIE